MLTREFLVRWSVGLALISFGACGGETSPPGSPAPAPPAGTANAYILPEAVTLDESAFGDRPVIVFTGERLRWVNVDSVTHAIAADSPDATDFRRTVDLVPGGEQSFAMAKPGTTRIHCAIHPNMTGTLIVAARR